MDGRCIRQSFLGEFFLLLNTAPLNAALVNSVSARIRATAMAVNIFMIHVLGDAFSPTLIGYISDRSNLQTGLTSMVVAVALSAAVLFYGMRFAPKMESEREATGYERLVRVATRGSELQVSRQGYACVVAGPHAANKLFRVSLVSGHDFSRTELSKDGLQPLHEAAAADSRTE